MSSAILRLFVAYAVPNKEVGFEPKTLQGPHALDNTIKEDNDR